MSEEEEYEVVYEYVYEEGPDQGPCEGIYYFEDSFWLLGFIFKLSLLTFMLIKFIQKDKKMRNIYFYLLFVGFTWNFIFTIMYNGFNFCWYLNAFGVLIGDSWENCYHIIMSMNISEWYHDKFCAIWTLALTLNRLTAIVWWQKYDRFWSKWFKYVLIFLLLYPFLINGSTFFHPECRFQTNTENCLEIWEVENHINTIASGVISVISLIVSGVTVYFYRKTLKGTKTAAQKTEHKLMFQAILSSFSFILYYTISSYSKILFFGGEEFWQVYLVKAVVNVLFMNSEFILLFIFSPIFRKLYFKFYFGCFYRLSQTRIQIISIPSTTMTSSGASNSTMIARSFSTTHK